MADNKDQAQQGKQDVLDQGGVGFTNEDAAGTSIGGGGGAGQANRQSADPGQDAGASNGQAWRPDVPDQSGVGFTPEDGGNVQGGQNRQSGNAGSGSQSESQAGSGQYTGGPGAGESRQSGFVHSSPDANVFPKGKAQADNPGHGGGASAAGTPDEGRLGGSGGTSAAGTTGNDPDR